MNPKVKKLMAAMANKKKKKPISKTSRTVALEGRKHFKHGGTNSMIRQAQQNYNGSYISGDLGGVKVGNKSYAKYYKGLI
jgi:hypothetical protein|tara:strand:+ start:837 stop:1076 length:240 start_codon:yes stop_codon:yes gene_type:complete